MAAPRPPQSKGTRAAFVMAVACAALAWWLPVLDGALPGGAFAWQAGCIVLAFALAAWAWRRLPTQRGGRVARLLPAVALALAVLWLLGLAILWWSR